MSIDYSKYEGTTPGPWKVFGHTSVQQKDSTRSIAVCDYFREPMNTQNKRNASLIADAPLLLAECKRLDDMTIGMNKIFHIIRTDGNDDYDTFSDFVCIAESDLDAKNTNPRGYGATFEEDSTWVSSPDHVRVEFLGYTQLPCGIICTSFHAG